MAQFDYDMLVIGSGPAGKNAAIQSAKLDKRAEGVSHIELLTPFLAGTG